MTTTWKIYNLEHEISNGLVIKVTYGFIVDSEGFLNRRVGEITLTGDPTSPNFVAYEDLTEEIVINWVKSELGEEAVTEIETQVQSQVQAAIDAAAAKTTQEGLPWIK
jgi:hypothetical protein